jgi:hypothetical protein
MSITFIGSAGVEANSITLPTHQAGDLIIIYAFRAASAIPSIPSGWFSVYARASASGGNRGTHIGYKVAATSGETSGTWTNASALFAIVYRHDTNYLIIGGDASGASNSTSLPYGLLNGYNSQNNDDRFRGESSRVGLGVWALTNNADLEQAPSGTTNRANYVGATYEAAWHDTNTAAASYAGATITLNNAVVALTTTVELLDTGIAKSSGGGFRAVNIRGGADQ